MRALCCWLALALCILPSLAPARELSEEEKKIAENIATLQDGRVVRAYRIMEVPEAARPPKQGDYACDRYVFIGRKGFDELLADGRYVTEDGRYIFLVNAGCMYPYVGSLTLSDDAVVDFYQSDKQNSDGNLVRRGGTAEIPLDGPYSTKDGGHFLLNNGYTGHETQLIKGELKHMYME